MGEGRGEGRGILCRVKTDNSKSPRKAQIDRPDAADYEGDLELFQASLDFVKSAR